MNDGMSLKSVRQIRQTDYLRSIMCTATKILFNFAPIQMKGAAQMAAR